MQYTIFYRQRDEQRQNITEATRNWQAVHEQLQKLEEQIKLPGGRSFFNPVSNSSHISRPLINEYQVYKAKRAEVIPRLEAILAKIRKFLDEQDVMERGLMDSLEKDRKV
jgi:uncharacterized coiled-coil DUF342 family protein